MKTKEELDALKAEVEMLNMKLRELTPDELALVVGGKCDTASVQKNKFGQFELHYYTVKKDQ